MISAEEARQKTILNGKSRDVLKSIDGKIKEAMYKGRYSCIYSFDEFDDILGNDAICALIREIRSLGYYVECGYDPFHTIQLAPGVYHCYTVIKISWEEEIK